MDCRKSPTTGYVGVRGRTQTTRSTYCQIEFYFDRKCSDLWYNFWSRKSLQVRIPYWGIYEREWVGNCDASELINAINSVERLTHWSTNVAILVNSTNYKEGYNDNKTQKRTPKSSRSSGKPTIWKLRVKYLSLVLLLNFEVWLAFRNLVLF